MFANHGSLTKHEHVIEGINSRMDGIQAAVLSVKLAHLARWNKRRFENALSYNDLLRDVDDVVTPVIRPDATHIFHLYVIRTQQRDRVQEYLKGKGISTGIHYPTPIHLQKAYADLGYKEGDFPHAEERAARMLSLPMFPEMHEEQVHYVAEQIVQYFEASPAGRRTAAAGQKGNPSL